MKNIFRNIFNASTIGLLFQGTFVPLTGGIPGSSSGSDLAGPLSSFFTQNSLPGFFQAAFTMALSIGAILAVLRLAWAGWLFMGAADMWSTRQHARDVIKDTVLGLALLIGIYIILFQINPCILNLNIVQDFQGSPQSCSAS